jgi:hypothetical protein
MRNRLVNKEYVDFLKRGGSLLLVKDKKIIFKSKENFLRPLLACIKEQKDKMAGAYTYDKLLGGAAALLFVYAQVGGVYALQGSKTGIETLKKYNIACAVEKTIACVLNDQGTDLCPMERLAQGKSPKEFYRVVLGRQ